jgi:hypothetical protein
VAPALDHYRYRLFYVKHGELAYPVDIYCDVIEGREDDGYYMSPDSPEGFIAALQNVLRAPKTVEIIRSLIAQSKA